MGLVASESRYCKAWRLMRYFYYLIMGLIILAPIYVPTIIILWVLFLM